MSNPSNNTDFFYSLPSNSDYQFKKIKTLLADRIDLDLSHYKDNHLHRRISYRIHQLPVKTYQEYYNYLCNHPNELQEFKEDLTIHVTSFFRDVDPFRYLESTLLPQIIQEKKFTEDRTIRILSAPCSSGEEPYSIAIIADYLKKRKDYTNLIKIYALDIEEKILDIARKGIYNVQQMANISSASIERNFDKITADTFHVKSHIRNYVEFLNHDLLKPINLTKLDLVVCRNFLIYITQQKQLEVMKNIIPAMNPHGFLILGKTEGYHFLDTNMFRNTNIREHIYQLI
jgi:chemotaxis methyl-accepting protein methylase